MNKKGLNPVVSAIILIVVTVAVSIAVATFMGTLTFTWREQEPEPIITDVYDPRNSTLRQAYNNCIEELERQNYTLYEAKFKKEVWLEAETFDDFLNLLEEHNKTMVFHDSPKGRGWLFWNRVGPFKAYIWFNEELPDKSIITIYYILENE